MSFESRAQCHDLSVGVIGLGRVGLPLACWLSWLGFPTVGIEKDVVKAAAYSDCEAPWTLEEPGLLQSLETEQAHGTLRIGCDPALLRGAEVVLICVQTPLLDKGNLQEMDDCPLREAVGVAAAHMRKGGLLVVESTIAPLTMQRVVEPIVHRMTGWVAGCDYYLAHVPERIQPGRTLETIKTRPRVIGGQTPACSKRAEAFYRELTLGELQVCSALEAEISKTAENAYRDVQIAFANELALACADLGADFWRVRVLVNQSPGRDVHEPGVGVGGHCIPKDSWLLIQNTAWSPLIKVARSVNTDMPAHVANMVEHELLHAGVAPDRAVVAILGIAYLPQSSDIRNSPGEALAKLLRGRVGTVREHDYYVDGLDGPLSDVLLGADCLVLCTAHDQYWLAEDHEEWLRIMRTPIIVDGRGAWRNVPWASYGWRYRCIGVSDEAGGE